MERRDDLIWLATDRLRRLISDLEGIEGRVKEDMTSNSQFLLQLLPDLRAQVGTTLQQIEYPMIAKLSEERRVKAEDNRHWEALRAAIQTYRHLVKLRTENG